MIADPATRRASEKGDTTDLRSFVGVFRYSGRALGLVWTTSRALTLLLAALTIVAGVLPAGVAWVGAQIVDAVVAASGAAQAGGEPDVARVFELVALEGLLVALIAAAWRVFNSPERLLLDAAGRRAARLLLGLGTVAFALRTVVLWVRFLGPPSRR